MIAMTKGSAAREWVRKAEHDLLNARNTLTTMGENCPYDTVCFHSQQAVEKYIKALLVHLAIEVLKIHDIDELAGLVPAGNKPSVSVEEIEKVTRYAVAARYPGAHDELNRQDAEESLRIAEKIRAWARKELPREVSE